MTAACAVGAGVTSYGSQICMTNSLRHVKAAPALAMSCALPASTADAKRRLVV